MVKVRKAVFRDSKVHNPRFTTVLNILRASDRSQNWACIKSSLTSKDIVVKSMWLLVAMDRNFGDWSNIKTVIFLFFSDLSVQFVCQVRFWLIGVVRHKTTAFGCLRVVVWQIDLFVGFKKRPFLSENFFPKYREHMDALQAIHCV